MCCPASPEHQCAFMSVPPSFLTQAKLHLFTSVGADEIDAIGKKRGGGGGDAGTRERESGLLQLLYEMDGFNQNDRVLVRAQPLPVLALLTLTVARERFCGCVHQIADCVLA